MFSSKFQQPCIWKAAGSIAKRSKVREEVTIKVFYTYRVLSEVKCSFWFEIIGCISIFHNLLIICKTDPCYADSSAYPVYTEQYVQPEFQLGWRYIGVSPQTQTHHGRALDRDRLIDIARPMKDEKYMYTRI